MIRSLKTCLCAKGVYIITIGLLHYSHTHTPNTVLHMAEFVSRSFRSEQHASFPRDVNFPGGRKGKLSWEKETRKMHEFRRHLVLSGESLIRRRISNGEEWKMRVSWLLYTGMLQSLWPCSASLYRLEQKTSNARARRQRVSLGTSAKLCFCNQKKRTSQGNTLFALVKIHK